MSHELRSPLNAILGFAQLMDSGSPPRHRPEGQHRPDPAGRLVPVELINEILDLALIESGRLSLSLEPMSLPKCSAIARP